jgi:ATP-dependent DNA helicase RecQ
MTARSLTPPPFPTLEAALKHYFGYEHFRPGQADIIDDILANRDVLAIMPTGAGKSLCFQLPALLKPGLMIVVSPLIALMQDQVQSLHDNGIGATFLNSSLTFNQSQERRQAILQGTIKLLYVAPESLMGEDFQEHFLPSIQAQVGVSGFAIDEAHCVSEWGHDFRPDYRHLSQLRSRYPDVPVVAFTATATQRVRDDIAQQLRLNQPRVHLRSFNRTNLYYEVRTKDKQSYAALLQHIQQNPGAGIIYCLSRKKVEEITAKLRQDGIQALPYHAGLDAQTRTENQTRFLRDDANVIVATIAFGMGINKPDVRFVIHFDLPRSIESYYQESGRAGRDSEPAHCLLFFGVGDIKTIEYLISQKLDPTTEQPLEDEQRIAHQQLRRVINYAEATDCRRTVQLSYFGEVFPGNCGNCDNCCQPKPLEDWTVEAQKFLSCVARCQERFGMNHIIDVLRGSKGQKVLQRRHDQLSTYGIGQDRSLDEWRQLARSLIHQQLMEETTDGYSVLKLNAQSWEVLRKQRQVMIAVSPDRTRQPSPTSDDHPITVSQPHDEELYNRLQSLRKKLADDQDVPPYVVFANASLRSMAQLQPQNHAQFLQIAGVGSRKLAQYGDRFIAEIMRFRQEKGLPTTPESTVTPKPATPKSAKSTNPSQDTRSVTWELYQQGLSPAQIAEQRELQVTTILTHLADLIERGYAVDVDAWIAPDDQQIIVAAIENLGADSLSVLREALGEAYSYGDLRLVRSLWQMQNPSPNTGEKDFG